MGTGINFARLMEIIGCSKINLNFKKKRCSDEKC